MSENRELYLNLNKNGQLILEQDILKGLNLQDKKVKCIVTDDQIILRNPISTVEQLCGCWGEESEDDYDFHVEIERFGDNKNASK